MKSYQYYHEAGFNYHAYSGVMPDGMHALRLTSHRCCGAWQHSVPYLTLPYNVWQE